MVDEGNGKVWEMGRPELGAALGSEYFTASGPVCECVGFWDSWLFFVLIYLESQIYNSSISTYHALTFL